MTQEKKLSLDVKARIANGRSRACGKCNHFPCGGDAVSNLFTGFH